MNISKITDDYAVMAQILPDDVAKLAAEGFKAIICNRPDNEEPGQPLASVIAAECEKHGMTFHHIPVSGMPIAAAAIEEQRQIITSSGGPVLGYCRSGQRSLVIWQASA